MFIWCHLSFTLYFVRTEALDLVSSLAKTILLLPNSIRCWETLPPSQSLARTLPKNIFRHVSSKLEGSIFLSTIRTVPESAISLNFLSKLSPPPTSVLTPCSYYFCLLLRYLL